MHAITMIGAWRPLTLGLTVTERFLLIAEVNVASDQLTRLSRKVSQAHLVVNHQGGARQHDEFCSLFHYCCFKLIGNHGVTHEM
jgi:hypothetical protein